MLQLRKPHARPIFTLGLLIAAGVLLAGCAGRPRPYVPSMQIPRRVAVLDFAASPKILTVPRELEGWWLGSHDVYRNENIGEQVADEIFQTLSDLPYVDLTSRRDYRYYVNGKRRLLESAYGGQGYSDAQINEMMTQVDRGAIGRDLGADIVVAGRVEIAETHRNRTIDWVSSRLRIVIDIIDARTGKPIGTIKLENSKNLQTQMRILRRELERTLPEFDRLIGGAKLS